ncbi:glycosyltransferase WbsX family protein [Yokenella regensburgei]|uniref:glycosyltransferase WbsX family protein n=1 Tax=Yokenella regensburgei TaxID=158877 RepID=UPI003ED9A53B
MRYDKIFCYYFPQFYSIPVNDFHWGAGFTDWDNVRNAEPLFDGHHQPRIPLNEKYYDQSKPEVIKEQVDLAQKYGIDGFNFYHYWFDGEITLERPMENFLNNKELNIEFCITWANETWSKRWVGEDDVILYKQTHKNDKNIWRKHFNYLLEFWKDSRYLNVDGKPVFIVYNPHLIKHASEMFNCWNEWLSNECGKTLHLVGIQVSDVVLPEVYKNYSSTLNFEPRYSYNSSEFKERGFFSGKIFQYLRYLPEVILNPITKLRHKLTSYEKVDYNSIWTASIKNAVRRCHDNDSNIDFIGAFIDWDNTSRYKNKSKVYIGSNPGSFEVNFNELISKTDDDSKNRIFFVNAWNEWSEGAYLEPDSANGYKYLEAISRVKSKLC